MQPTLFARPQWIDYLQDDLLPLVLAQAQAHMLRIWSVGCQTGDEASILALALYALLGEQMADWQVRIFATDLDPLTLARARQRVYPDPSPASEWWQEGFHAYENETSLQGSRLTKSLRNTIIFAPHDLLYQPPFPNLNLIICHTSLVSWAPEAQTIVFNRFAYSLAAHRYLWLVPDVTVSPNPDFWQSRDADQRLYRRIASAVPLQSLQWKRPPAFMESPASTDEQADIYMEELQASLEEREVNYQELEQRMQELEQANERLAQLNRLKEDFLSMTSHELRTPLTSLLVYTDLLHRLWEDEGNQQAVQYVSRMQTQLEKFTRLVSDLLDSSNLRAGKLVCTKGPVFIDELVREVVENVQLTTLRHRIVLDAGTPCEVIGDRDRLGQVITNLLTNAIKYSPQADQVLVRLACVSDELIVSVQDFGIGISSDSQQRVFEQFYRDASSVSQLFPGLGIGLYLAHQIIALHSVRIWVESAPGQGSTFSFALPIK